MGPLIGNCHSYLLIKHVFVQEKLLTEMVDELQDSQEQLKLVESRLACMVEAGGGLAKILGLAIYVGYSRPGGG